MAHLNAPYAPRTIRLPVRGDSSPPDEAFGHVSPPRISLLARKLADKSRLTVRSSNLACERCPAHVCMRSSKKPWRSSVEPLGAIGGSPGAGERGCGSFGCIGGLGGKWGLSHSRQQPEQSHPALLSTSQVNELLRKPQLCKRPQEREHGSISEKPVTAEPVRAANGAKNFRRTAPCWQQCVCFVRSSSKTALNSISGRCRASLLHKQHKQ